MEKILLTVDNHEVVQLPHSSSDLTSILIYGPACAHHVYSPYDHVVSPYGLAHFHYDHVGFPLRPWVFSFDHVYSPYDHVHSTYVYVGFSWLSPTSQDMLVARLLSYCKYPLLAGWLARELEMSILYMWRNWIDGIL